MSIDPQGTPENGSAMGELALPRTKDDAAYIAIYKDPVRSRPSKSFFAAFKRSVLLPGRSNTIPDCHLIGTQR